MKFKAELTSWDAGGCSLIKIKERMLRPISKLQKTSSRFLQSYLARAEASGAAFRGKEDKRTFVVCP